MLVWVPRPVFLAGMGAPTLYSQWLQGLIDFAFPPLCLGCGEYTEKEFFICDACLKAIDQFEQPFCLACATMLPDGARCPTCGDDALVLYAWGNYTGPLEQVIIQLKFKGIVRPSRFFADAAARQFARYLDPPDNLVLVPIPLHPTRENRRGYNQATVFATHLSEALGTALRTDILLRIRKRRPQARLNHRERAVNIRGVYQIAEDAADETRAVVLVDDVVTSGATVREAARTLQQAGLKVHGVISIAHAL